MGSERREYQRQWYQRNKEKINAKKSVWKKNNPEYLVREKNRIAKTRKEKRIEAINILGGKCLRCGFDDIRALQFDHKIPVRRRDKGIRNHGGCLSPTEFRLIIEKQPHNIQLLCANCHAIKTTEDRARGWIGSPEDVSPTIGELQ